MTMKAHVRHCDPSLPSNWHDDPPQTVRALLQNLLHNALSMIVTFLHLAVALPHLPTRPRIEPTTFFTNSDQSPAFPALTARSIKVPSMRKSLHTPSSLPTVACLQLHRVLLFLPTFFALNFLTMNRSHIPLTQQI